MELFKSNTLNKKFQENGFVKLQLIGPKSVKNLKDIYLKYWQEHSTAKEPFHSTSDTNNPELINTINCNIKSILIPELNKAFTNIEYFVANFLIKEPIFNSAVSPHQDWTFVNEEKHQSMNIWIGLDDVGYKQGCMFFIPKSHKTFNSLRLSPKYPAFYEDYRNSINRFGKHLPTKSGEGFIFNHGIIHGSTANQGEKERVAVVIGAHNSGSELVHYFMENYDLREIEKYKMEIEDFITLKKDQRPNKKPADLNWKYDFKKMPFVDFKKKHRNFFLETENRVLKSLGQI